MKYTDLCLSNFSLNKLLIYMLRWQLSTPILGVFTYWLTGASPLDSMWSAVIANLVGSLIFFWVDLITFLSGSLSHQWEVQESGKCVDCGSTFGRQYRLVIAPKYNKLKDKTEFRCELCSIAKTEELRSRGIKI